MSNYYHRVKRSESKAPRINPANYPHWTAMAAYCADRPHCLTERERDFIHDLPNWTSCGPTWNQFKWLVKIFERLNDLADDATGQRVRQALRGGE